MTRDTYQQLKSQGLLRRQLRGAGRSSMKLQMLKQVMGEGVRVQYVLFRSFISEIFGGFSEVSGNFFGGYFPSFFGGFWEFFICFLLDMGKTLRRQLREAGKSEPEVANVLRSFSEFFWKVFNLFLKIHPFLYFSPVSHCFLGE
jgi:succinate-acetate transporter protein